MVPVFTAGAEDDFGELLGVLSRLRLERLSKFDRMMLRGRGSGVGRAEGSNTLSLSRITTLELHNFVFAGMTWHDENTSNGTNNARSTQPFNTAFCR